MKKTIVALFLILILAAFLRLWKLDKVPVSLFGDELDVGYQAYSVLKTGRDYSGNYLPLNFQSLAEWRTPLYLYSAVPSIAIFGISPWGVRLPAAIFGIIGILGMYLLIKEVMEYGLRVTRSNQNVKNPQLETLNRLTALMAAFLLALSPWHIQYSRAGFEVTELIAFLLFGLYFFFLSLRKPKYLWISVAFLVVTPLIYSTAKFFTPILMVILTALWFRKLAALPKKFLVAALLTGLLLGLPVAYATVFSGGTARFSYIGIFTDPVIEPEVGTSRLMDALTRGEVTLGLKPSLADKFFHNKFVYIFDRFSANYLQAYSTDFLFINGDPNPRHSINGMGELYAIEIIPLLLGALFFFTKFGEIKVRLLLFLWLAAGVLPAALTRDGGNHATRLILILPPLIFLVAFGLSSAFTYLTGKKKYFLSLGYSFCFLLSVIFYQHLYWVHNPWDSERWWHAGYEESFKTIKSIDSSYDRIIITMQSEPAWIFFAGWYEYPPDKWHQGYPFKKADISGFGEISYIDKYYFGSLQEGYSLYDLPKFINNKTLYLAAAKEIGANLIQEPERVPPGLKLIKAVPFPSGEPAYYLFTKE